MLYLYLQMIVVAVLGGIFATMAYGHYEDTVLEHRRNAREQRRDVVGPAVQEVVTAPLVQEALPEGPARRQACRDVMVCEALGLEDGVEIEVEDA